MPYPEYVVYYDGHPACPCQVKWLPELERQAQRAGLIKGALPVSQLIGGDPRSGGTHLKGGATDFYPLAAITNVPAFIRLCRDMGADATWRRPYNWDGANGVEHAHAVLTGCPHNGPAAYQIDAVRADQNGLANHGKDDGPRPLSGRTWREGIAWARAQEDDMQAEDWDRLEQIVTKAVAAEFAKEQKNGRTLRGTVAAIANKLGVKPVED